MVAKETAALVRVRYEEPEAREGSLVLPTDGFRAEGRLRARVVSPSLLRDGLLSVSDAVASDLRRKASDRSDYLAYVLGKGGKVTQQLWDAQKEFLARAYGEARADEAPLDPIVTVAKDRVSIEAFSKDESAYARLDLSIPSSLEASELSEGTASLNLSSALANRFQRLRAYRPTELEVTPAQKGSEKELRVPYRWLRAFSEVQAAATLPATTFELAPIDLYNVLLVLRRKKAKKPPRALRYELVPGERPRLVLEPWDKVIEASGPAFKGSKPEVVRTFGRNRLALLARLLPHAKGLRVFTSGPGLPVSYVVDAGAMTFTLSLSGWTDSGWAGIATFDLLAAGAVDELLAERVARSISTSPGKSLEELVAELLRPASDVRAAVLSEIQRGGAYFDLSSRRFRGRRLVSAPLPAERLKFRDATEEKAHRLLEVEGQVQLTKIHDKGLEGTAIEGHVEDRVAHRAFDTSFVVDREGRTSSATCGCPKFRKAALREGPCEHMIALRIKHGRELAERERMRATPEGRKLIRAETRTFTKRVAGREETRRVSLEDRTVVLREERPAQSAKVVRLFFRKADDARQEYFSRLDTLGDQGFVDASSAEAS
ncbi:MAG: hypothetical protein HY791_34385 [Deltaproteobacteria bacterium]|nr:hypothetical protein [Deltaproteobacteria bacterium]